MILEDVTRTSKMCFSNAFDDFIEEAISQGLSFPKEAFIFAYSMMAEEFINRAEDWCGVREEDV